MIWQWWTDIAIEDGIETLMHIAREMKPCLESMTNGSRSSLDGP